MSLLDILKTVYFNLKSNKGRSILSILGIVIGIASVIIIISAGAGAQGLILNQIKSVGSNVLNIMPGKSEEKEAPVSIFGIVITTLTSDDAEAIKKEIPKVEGVSGSVRGPVSAKYENKNSDTTFVGVSAEYLEVRDAEVSFGRFFTEEEEKTMAKVAVLGSAVKNDLFPDSDPTGKRVKIKKENFLIIGAMKERGTIAFQNEDNQIFVPLKTAQKLLLGIDYVNAIMVKISEASSIEQVKINIKQLLRFRHKIENPADDDFTVRDPQQALEALTTVTDALKFFLAGIAAISLIVGGIGIMNIMLISVAERTREIGLRKAIGATNRSVLLQFIFETIIMSSIGGAIGIAIGIAATFLIAIVARYLEYDWNFIVSFSSIILAVSVSVIVGLVFGLWPAYQAAKKEPIEALRYE